MLRMRKKSEADKTEQVLRERLEHRRMAGERSLWRYVLAKIRAGTFFGYCKMVLAWFRRLRFVGVLFRAVTATLTLLETGALFLLGTALFVVLLPALLLGVLGILLVAYCESGRTNRRFAARTEGKPIYLLFLSREAGTYFFCNAKDLAKKEGGTVFAVSPYWFSTRGMREGSFYFTARREAQGVYLIRPYYFFSLKRSLLRERNFTVLY